MNARKNSSVFLLIVLSTTSGCHLSETKKGISSGNVPDREFQPFGFSADHLLQKPMTHVDLRGAKLNGELPDRDRAQIEALLGRVPRIPTVATEIETVWGSSPVAAHIELPLDARSLEFLYVHCVKTSDVEWHISAIESIRGERF